MAVFAYLLPIGIEPTSLGIEPNKTTSNPIRTTAPVIIGNQQSHQGWIFTNNLPAMGALSVEVLDISRGCPSNTKPVSRVYRLRYPIRVSPLRLCCPYLQRTLFYFKRVFRNSIASLMPLVVSSTVILSSGK